MDSDSGGATNCPQTKSVVQQLMQDDDEPAAAPALAGGAPAPAAYDDDIVSADLAALDDELGPSASAGGDPQSDADTVPRMWPIRSVAYPQTLEHSEEERQRRKQRLSISMTGAASTSAGSLGAADQALGPARGTELPHLNRAAVSEAMARSPDVDAPSATTEASAGSVSDIDSLSLPPMDPTSRSATAVAIIAAVSLSQSEPHISSSSSSASTPPNLAMTSRFVHAETISGGNYVLTGRQGRLARCEDEPIHAPGAIQTFGVLLALDQTRDGRLMVQQVSENSERIIGVAPVDLLRANCLSEVFPPALKSEVLEAIEVMEERYESSEDRDCGPYTFDLAGPGWSAHAAVHRPSRTLQPDRIVLELEPVNVTSVSYLRPTTTEDDGLSATGSKPGLPSAAEVVPDPEELDLSTKSIAKPLHEIRRWINDQRNGINRGIDLIGLLNQVNEQFLRATELEPFLRLVACIFKDITRFDRAMLYQFDESWNGRVVAEHVDWSRTKDLFRGLNFPASDIPPQARELYRINKVRVLYDRDQPTARMCCRNLSEVQTPLDMTHCHLRAMSPIHLKYLANMGVRSTMSISITAFGDLWGLVALHGYGDTGHHVPFPLRQVCKLFGETISRNIERLSYRHRVQSRKLINTAVSIGNPAGYIVANATDLLALFEADFGILRIGNEAKTLGILDNSQELFAILNYLRKRQFTTLQSTNQFVRDFGSEIDYPPGFSLVAGMLTIPLSASGEDFICFLRKSQAEHVSWAGNPYENKSEALAEGDPKRLEPRTSFRIWNELVTGRCRAWTDEQLETGAVLCLVYGKFIAVWREKETALAHSSFTNLLLANASHEVRTPLNAIINYIELALDHDLAPETRDHLAKSHNASRSLVLTINDLLDLTRSARSGELSFEEPFDLLETINDASAVHKAEAERRHLSFDIVETPSGTPPVVIGDQGRLRRILTVLIGNAVKFCNFGGVTIEWGELADTDLDEAIVAKPDGLRLGISVIDSGIGMSPSQLESLFRGLEQVSSIDDPQSHEGTLGLGLAVASRTLSNLGGQLRVESRQGWGSRFTAIIPFRLPAPEIGGALPPATRPAWKHALFPGQDLGHGKTAAGSRRPSSLESLVEAISSSHMPPTDSSSSSGSGVALASKSPTAWRKNRVPGATARPTVETESRPGQTTHSPHLTVPTWSVADARAARAVEISPPASPRDPRRRPSGEALPHSWMPVRGLKLPHNGAGPVSPGSQASSQPVLDRCAWSSDEMIASTVASSSYIDQSASESMTSITHGPAATQPSPVGAQLRPSKRSWFNRSSDECSHDEMTRPLLSKRILVVEDERVNRMILQARLIKDGHEVVTVEHGGDALRLLDKDSRFDLVLMDLAMPIMGGLEATRKIREREARGSSKLYGRRLAIFAVSASLPERDRPTIEEAGVDGWLTKPVNLDRLRELIKGLDSEQKRNEDVYAAGAWERGGWLHASPNDPSLRRVA